VIFTSSKLAIQSRDPGIGISQSRNPGIGKDVRDCNPYPARRTDPEIWDVPENTWRLATLSPLQCAAPLFCCILCVYRPMQPTFDFLQQPNGSMKLSWKWRKPHDCCSALLPYCNVETLMLMKRRKRQLYSHSTVNSRRSSYKIKKLLRSLHVSVITSVHVSDNRDRRHISWSRINQQHSRRQRHRFLLLMQAR